MRRFVDLHTHSTASDGALSPRHLVRAADAAQLAVLALTDHDTTAGLAEASAAAKVCRDLRFVAGIEVSADFIGGTMHILGLGIDEHAAAITNLCRYLQAARSERNPKIISKLQELGLAISMEEVLSYVAASRSDAPHDEVVSRVHIAQVLHRKGLVGSLQEAFDRYLAYGAKAYVAKERAAPSRIISAIHSAGGMAVLAHPVQLKYANRLQLERILRQLIHHGLEGIEVYHRDHSPVQTRQYLELARRFGLAVTGGSDFHGPSPTHGQLARPRVPLAAIDTTFLSRLVSS